jgi:hypothetical protein
MRSLLLLVALAACRESNVGKVDKTAPATAEAPRPAHGAGRDRWRGGGVYVDGVPIGALRYAELPRELQPIWETQRHRLPFKAGEPIRETETKVPRYRLTDYLTAIGISIDQIKEVHLHGGREAAIVLSREDLRAHPDDILFRFAGDTYGKPVPQIRGVDVGTSFDDLRALAIYVQRTPPTLTAEHTLVLDGRPVVGIPYYGQPMREGIRVYLDDRMVAVLKRNQSAQQTDLPLAGELAKLGVDTKSVERMQLIYDEARGEPQPWAAPQFAFNPAGSGEVFVGSQPATAIALYTSAKLDRQ